MRLVRATVGLDVYSTALAPLRAHMWNMTLTCLAVLGSGQLFSNDGKEWKITTTSTSAGLLTGCMQEKKIMKIS